MRINDLYPSKYLRAGDLDGDTPVTMKSLILEEINGEKKPVLYFEEPLKPMVLNKTNGKTIANLHGSETDNWPGKRIILYPTEVDFRGETVDAIRVRKQIPVQGSGTGFHGADDQKVGKTKLSHGIRTGCPR